jgi:hypothetical protein
MGEGNMTGKHVAEMSPRYEVVISYKDNPANGYRKSTSDGAEDVVASALLATGRTTGQSRDSAKALVMLAESNAHAASVNRRNYAPEASAWFGALSDRDVPVTATVRVL